MLLSFARFIGALLGFFFGFYLGAALLEVSRVTPPSNQVVVVVLLGVACSIIGWLGAPYATVVPAAAIARRLGESTFGDLAGASAGASVGLLLGALLTYPVSQLPGELGRFGPAALAIGLGLVGMAAGVIKHEDLARALGELRAPVRRQAAAPRPRALLDTSVIIDGRVADVAHAGFITGTLLLPRFILAELQLFADSTDPLRRDRGRRGLELLARMQREDVVSVEVIDDDPPEQGADAKLVALARSLGVPLITNDYGLDRVAQLQGVRVLNMNELTKAVRPVLLPGEDVDVRVIAEGKEAGQGVGYLEDGTMIVVEGGVRHLGSEVTVTVMRILQTAAGRMIFAQPKADADAARRVRAISR